MSAINLKLQYGTLANMPATITNGTMLVATDVEKAFVDVNGIRVSLGDVVTSYTEAQIKAIAKANALPKLYMASDSLLLYFFDPNGGEEDPETHTFPGAWRQVGGSVSHADSADKDGAGNVITTTYKTVESAAADYQALVGMISQINSFDVQIVANVASLPDPGNSHTIYFVPSNPIPTDPDYNVYDEYMWVVKTPAHDDVPAVYGYEHIGTTETDLTNYYTKAESDATEAAIYAALGITKSEAEDAGYTTFDARLDALESSASTDGGRIDELEAKFGNYADSTAQGFTSVEARFTAAEGRLTTAEGDIDAVEGRLDTAEGDIDAVEGRLDTDEAAITEINAKLGNMADSTSTGFVSVEDRLAALESDSTDADAIAEIQAQIGNYAASTDVGFVSIEDRFTTDESNISALQTEVGAATDPAAGSLRGRMSAAEGRLTTAEGDIDAVEGRLDTAESAITTAEGDIDALETRMDTAEGNITTAQGDIDNLEAAVGTYVIDTTSQDYKGTIAERLDAIEGDSTDADAIAELQAKFGDYADSTDADFVSVEARFSAVEGDVATAQSDIDAAEARLDTAEGDIDAAEANISALQTEVGAASNPDANSLRGRMAAAESAITTAQGDIDAAEGRLDTAESAITTAQADITEIQAKIGATYPASTDTGFVSIDGRLTTLESAVGNINRFEVQVIPDGESLPVTGEPYTLYFVRQNAIPTDPDYNVFEEYMWVVKTPAQDETPAVYGYELLGTTETDLTNYYTKSEIDAVIGDASTTGTIIYRIKTNEDAIAELEAKFGNYAASTAQGFTSVEARFTDAEGRLTTAEGDIDAAEGRLDTAESAITALQTEVGAATDPAAASLRGRMAAAETAITAAEGDIDALEGDVARIDAELGTLDSTALGYRTVADRLDSLEAGNVSQAEDDDDAEKPVLVSGSNTHDSVEYVPNVTVNAENGSVTANQIKLGAATLEYDTTTGALVINY